MRKLVALAVIDRANWGRLKPVAEEIRRQDLVDLRILCGGTTLSSGVVEAIEREGYKVTRVCHEVAGSTHESMSQSVGLGVLGFTQALASLEADIVLMVGDRYEALGVAVAASMLGTILVHVQGGEVSGSIDERIRHAISKLACYHVPSTVRSASYLTRMGEHADSLLTIGCPSGDIAHALKQDLKSRSDEIVVLFHPVTTERTGGDQMKAVLQGVARVRGERRVTVWKPNIDPGSNAIRDAIKGCGFQLVTNLSPELFLERIARAACLVGNSSSFIRDASFFGTPVVLVGTRQDGREWDEHVQRVDADADKITATVEWQLAHGPYPASELYGDGQVSKRIADALVSLKPRDKKLSYVNDARLPEGGCRNREGTRPESRDRSNKAKRERNKGVAT